MRGDRMQAMNTLGKQKRLFKEMNIVVTKKPQKTRSNVEVATRGSFVIKTEVVSAAVFLSE